MRKKIYRFIGLVLLVMIGTVIFFTVKNSGSDSDKKKITAEPTEFLIDRLNKPISGVIISPQTTAELEKWFAGSDEYHVPRVFVKRLPDDFAEKGNRELFSRVIAALILRANERIIKERFVLKSLMNKWQKGIEWTRKEKDFFRYLIEQYDAKSRKTIPTQLADLMPKIDQIPPAMAIIQAAEATDWGKHDLDSPFEQTGWLDRKTYTRVPFPSLIEATDSYVQEMNGLPSLSDWRYLRSKYIQEDKDNIGYRILRWLGDYRLGDQQYSDRLYERMEELDWYIPDSLSFIKPKILGKNTLKIKDKSFTVEVAKTPEEMAYGLMFRPNLPVNTGMIFLQAHPTDMAVWMKNTFVPLDILFFDGRRRIVQILKDMKPLDERPRHTAGPVKGMIELPAGTVQKYQIKIGDKVSF